MPIAWWLAAALAAPPDRPVRLDAGTLVTPLQAGFDRLTAHTSEDPRVTWRQRPRDAEADAWPDPLAADGLVGGTLHLDLPAGDWVAWVVVGTTGERVPRWLGDRRLVVDGETAWSSTVPPWPARAAHPRWAPNPHPAFRPGETAWHRQVAPRFPWVRVPLTVGPDGLTLALEGTGLRALVVVPAEREPDGDVFRALTDAGRALWWQAVHAPHLADGPGLPAWVDAPASLTPVDGALPPIHLGRDDRVGVLLRLPEGPGTWTVEPPAGVEAGIAEVRWLDRRGHPSLALRPRPAVRMDGPGWRGDQGLPPLAHLRLRTDAATRPGRHRLTVRAGDEALDLVLVVHDLTPPAGRPSGVYLQAPPALAADPAAWRDASLAGLDALADAGLTAVSLRYTTDLARPDTGTRLWEEAARRWAARGGRRLIWPDVKVPLRAAAYARDGDVLSPEGADLLQRADASLRAIRAAAPTLTVDVHLWEEEGWKHLAALDRVDPFTAAVRERLPGARLLAAMPTAAGRTRAGRFDTVTVGGPGPALRDAVAAARAAGAGEVWVYNDAPGAGGPLRAWAVGADGFLQWHADPMAWDPWDGTPHHATWRHLVLDAEDGRTVLRTTLAFEALADGVALARWLDLADHLDVSAEAREGLRDHLLHARPTDAGGGALLPLPDQLALRATLLPRLARAPRPRRLETP